MKKPIELFKEWTQNPSDDPELDIFFKNKYADQLIRSILYHEANDNYFLQYGYYTLKKSDIVSTNEDGSIFVNDKITNLFNKISMNEIVKNHVQKNTYLLMNNRNGYYKIGRSINILKREKTLQSEDPDISLISSTPIDIEFELHQKYKDKHIRGEWFSLNESDVKDIIDRFNTITPM